MKFRNYQPYDSGLVSPIEKEHQNALVLSVDLEKQNEVSNLIEQELSLVMDIGNVLPKKSNWDLKSQAHERIEKLKRRTQRSIVEMLREKFAGNESDELS